MIRGTRWLLWLCVLLPSCATSAFEELSALADKPPLPYSVLVTGGAFVQRGGEGSGELASTYSGSAAPEVFELKRLAKVFEDTRVFVAVELDSGDVAERQTIARLDRDSGSNGGAAADRLAALRRRARRAGHDAILVVESVHDGPIEDRGINDRWPFTLGAWLFALGALIPDQTYESRARLRVVIRDIYTGRKIGPEWEFEPGSVDLNMFDRCSAWGFVQSIVVPPFFTSVNNEKITASVRELSIDRMLVAAVRRLKSIDVSSAFRRHGPAVVEVTRVGGEWSIRVVADEPLSALALRVDGRALDADAGSQFEGLILASRRVDGNGDYVYEAKTRLPGGRRVQVLVQTEAARIRSFTFPMGSR